MILETPRLRLRPLQLSDLEAFHSVVNCDPSVTWTGVARTFKEGGDDVAAKVQLSEAHGFGVFAVFERQTNEFWGYTGLEPFEETGAMKLSFYLGQIAWSQGFATELGRMLLGYGFHVLKLERIVAVVRSDNLVAQQVLSKLGFVHERTASFSCMPAQYWSLMRSSTMN
jgi:RimJ/RimL family protein N-acetyltransferase